MDYAEAIRAIVHEEQEIIGAVAVQKARDLPFIELDAAEDIVFTRNVDWDDVETVIGAYADLQGMEAAIGIAKKAIRDAADRDHMDRVDRLDQ